MSGKSRRERRKRLSQGKKRKGALVRTARQQPISQIPKPVSPPSVSTPSAKVPVSRERLTVVRNPFIITELRRIGILAGVILTILIVMALVLS